MYLISDEGYINAGVHFLRVQKTGEIWPSMKDVGNSISVKNISDLVLKEIHGVRDAKTPTKEQINKYKMTEKEINEKFGNLSEDELNTKSNKIVYARNDAIKMMLLNVVEAKKKKGIRAINGFRKKLMIPDFEIPECPEFEVKSKIGNKFVNEKILEEYSVEIYKIDPYFYEHYGKKYKLIKLGVNIYYLELMFILLNIS